VSKVGWLGLGKLGFPTAMALSSKGGHTIFAADPYPPSNKPEDWEYEEGMPEIFADGDYHIELCADPGAVVRETDGVVFVAVQTPHGPEYGGDRLMPIAPMDFNYRYLVGALRELSRSAVEQKKEITISVISTVLPGTYQRELGRFTNSYVKIVYNPFFIALGTTVTDFLDPPFVLAGAENPVDSEPLRELYRTLHGKLMVTTSVANAELIKVAYNSYMSLTIAFVNEMQQIAEEVGADIDSVIAALRIAPGLSSLRMVRAGNPDGGPCRPRDAIAMSWLQDRLAVPGGLFEFLVETRESHAQWIADCAEAWSDRKGSEDPLPVKVLGRGYKPGSTHVAGSPALLLANVIGCRAMGINEFLEEPEHEKAVYVIGTDEPELYKVKFPRGSVIIDHHGNFPAPTPESGVTVVRPGRTPTKVGT
jgi:UDPglucose 6-dehydrogenase